MSRQVRISNENADWLEQQGGSLSAAADRTLEWARAAIEGAEEMEEEAEVAARPVPAPANNGLNDHPPRAGKTSTSTRSARRISFSPIIRRP